jgi:hypothetical protein
VGEGLGRGGAQGSGGEALDSCSEIYFENHSVYIYIIIMRNGHQNAGALLRIDRRTQARVEKLAVKCNEGKLTTGERTEYEAYVQASTLIGILQAKARKPLAKAKAN